MRIAFYNAWQPKATKLDKVIAIATFGMFSHVELVFSNWKWFSISPRENTARFKKIHANKQSWEYIYLDDITPDEELQLYNEAIKYLGTKYDYIGALFSTMPFCIQKEDRVFCSEVTVDILRTLPKFSFLKKGCIYSPNDLYRSLKKRNFRSSLDNT